MQSGSWQSKVHMSALSNVFFFTPCYSCIFFSVISETPLHVRLQSQEGQSFAGFEYSMRWKFLHQRNTSKVSNKVSNTLCLKNAGLPNIMACFLNYTYSTLSCGFASQSSLDHLIHNPCDYVGSKSIQLKLLKCKTAELFLLSQRGETNPNETWEHNSTH